MRNIAQFLKIIIVFKNLDDQKLSSCTLQSCNACFGAEHRNVKKIDQYAEWQNLLNSLLYF